MTLAPAPAFHIHLDAVGGVAGDMFIAALLAMRPQDLSLAVDAARAAGLPAGWSIDLKSAKADGFAGSRFVVSGPAKADHHHDHPDAVGHHHHHHDEPGHHHAHVDHHHEHVRHRDIIALIDRSALAPGVKSRAKAIFALLAEAEAEVHGVDALNVAFHEVADWDSVADIVAAAALIERLGPQTGWSVSSLPLGSGRVKTAHGLLPVPAPATALLLRGFRTHDDGIAGERITPTGAAILSHLRPLQEARPSGRLVASGAGFGTKRLPGLPNMLRALAFEKTDAASALDRDEVALLAFEIDDQTAEDLAVALERIRGLDGVLDALQHPAFGKKGRMLAGVQVLCRPDIAEVVAAACLSETTTLGVRVQTVGRRLLKREHGVAPVNGGDVRVKTATRPDGRRTAKAEMDDLAHRDGRDGRTAARAAAEHLALQTHKPEES